MLNHYSRIIVFNIKSVLHGESGSSAGWKGRARRVVRVGRTVNAFTDRSRMVRRIHDGLRPLLNHVALVTRHIVVCEMYHNFFPLCLKSRL